MTLDERRQHLLLTVPAVIVVVAVAIFPLLYALRTSFFNFNLLRPTGGGFVGLANYIDILSRHDFWHSVYVTLALTASAVALELILGLLVALVLAARFTGSQVLRTLLSIPVMTAPLVAGIVFLIIFNNSFGVLNYSLELVGLPRPQWLGRPGLAFAVVVCADVWRTTPFMMLVLVAGLQSIPREQYESASIDGAGKLRSFISITLPGLNRFIYVGVVFRVIDALRMYDTIYVLTGGGPDRATENLSVYIYRYGFSEYRMGFSSASSVIFLAIVVAVTLPLVLNATVQRNQ